MDARTELRLQRINAKGLQVASKLADLMAGKDIDLNDMQGVWEGDEDRDDEERLRTWLDAINAARHRIQSGAYGRCLACDEPLDPAALDEIPWLERCPACEATDAPIRR
ncbi:MAG: hypothetical protein ACQEXJ_13485 [Myxococcota bacterium]